MVCFVQVNQCSFSSDGKLLLTGSDDFNVCVWDVEEEKLLFKVTGHTGPVKACAFSVDSTLFATGSYDCTVRVWNMKAEECLHILQGHSRSVETVCFSRDSTLLVSGSWDHKAILWNPKASGSWDKTVRVWDSRNGRLIFLLTEHTGRVLALSFSLDAILLMTAAGDETVNVKRFI
ncbi:uncharacterized protein LOC144686121 [Cetorhinus maximus]